MHLVRTTGRFGASANRPTLDGAPADPFRFTDALCDGFRAAYTAVSDSRAELLGQKGLLRLFADDETRFVPRPTWTYATLLHESTHPDLMRDAAERQQVFALLRTGALGTPALAGLEDEEIAELWQGDVPVFTTRPDFTEVWSGSGRRMRGPAGPTGLARVEAKIRALDTVDRLDQERIIRTAMVSTSTEPPHGAAGSVRPRTEATAPEPERLLSAARSVGDQLVSLAYHSGSRTNWIGLELLGERYWRLTPLAADLAGGYTGPALFLAQLASLTGAARYADAARAALAPLPGLLDALHLRGDDLGMLGSGAFSGLGGIAYALTEVGTLLDDSRVLDWSGPATRLACAASSAEEGLGVRGGAAGGWCRCSPCTAPPAGPRPGAVPSGAPNVSWRRPRPRPGASRTGRRASAGHCCGSPGRGAARATGTPGWRPCGVPYGVPGAAGPGARGRPGSRSRSPTAPRPWPIRCCATGSRSRPVTWPGPRPRRTTACATGNWAYWNCSVMPPCPGCAPTGCAGPARCWPPPTGRSRTAGRPDTYLTPGCSPACRASDTGCCGRDSPTASGRHCSCATPRGPTGPTYP